jgi:SAM-dependent methyltransferase
MSFLEAMGNVPLDMQTLWPLLIGILVMVLCMIYLWEYLKVHRKRRALPDGSNLSTIEGFANPGESGSDERQDHLCYDNFYAKVYDSLVQPKARAGIEVQAPLDFLKEQGRDLKDIRVADIGCGTGMHVEYFRQRGVRSVFGYDKSADMIQEAKRKYPASATSFFVGDATVATMMASEQTDLITMYYFTLYLEPKRTEMLKNIYLWLAPGGVFCVHIVNKHKFDPILESASPFMGFSVQKYVPERVTKSQVTFEEFEYTGDFQLHGSRAMFEESFQFKDGKKRRHLQRVWMPNIEAMVSEVQDVGFKLLHHVDLTAIGYEYQYLFFFGR